MISSSEWLQFGFLRGAVVIPALKVADPDFNTQVILDSLPALAEQGVQIVLFPELCLTGYTCGDLFFQRELREQALEGLARIQEMTQRFPLLVVVGLPLEIGGRLFNSAVLLGAGRIYGAVPKSHLPNRHEFYEARWFTPASQRTQALWKWQGQEIPFGEDLLFPLEGHPQGVIGLELCEDLWAVHPPSGNLALAGATLLLNPSASNEILGKAAYRRSLVQQQSARCLAAYLYASAGLGESSTDLVYSGHGLIAENGQILGETPRFAWQTQSVIVDLDLERLQQERLNNSAFAQASPLHAFRLISVPLPKPEQNFQTLQRPLSRWPFVPQEASQRAEHCHEIFAIQAAGLAKRLQHTGVSRVTLGLSGGLDSTLALLVAVKAFDQLGLAREGIVTVTMPGFGTSRRTRTNAEKLARRLGTTLRILPIQKTARQHFQAIGHAETEHNVVYENVQARLRTQWLMDIANQIGGFVVGTGDLSELALGWCTYNGDQMSMYHVNAGVPKTLVRFLVEWAAEAEFEGQVSQVLQDVASTPISPELLPLGEGEQIRQKTEETVGPYELHDFFLWHIVRYGASPYKVLRLAEIAFAESYETPAIGHWLKVFLQRFFSQQFKRSAMPDGPKVGSVALSPRGDWRMPSDASAAIWLKAFDDLSIKR